MTNKEMAKLLRDILDSDQDLWRDTRHDLLRIIHALEEKPLAVVEGWATGERKYALHRHATHGRATGYSRQIRIYLEKDCAPTKATPVTVTITERHE